MALGNDDTENQISRNAHEQGKKNDRSQSTSVCLTGRFKDTPAWVCWKTWPSEKHDRTWYEPSDWEMSDDSYSIQRVRVCRASWRMHDINQQAWFKSKPFSRAWKQSIFPRIESTKPMQGNGAWRWQVDRIWVVLHKHEGAVTIFGGERSRSRMESSSPYAERIQHQGTMSVEHEQICQGLLKNNSLMSVLQESTARSSLGWKLSSAFS